MGCNPICCCDLKTGVIWIGAASVLMAIIELGVFGWQTNAVKVKYDKTANDRLPQFGSFDPHAMNMPGNYDRYYESYEEQFYFAVFVIQIVKIVADFIFLCGSATMICGVFTNSKHLIWPYIVTIACNMSASLAYCIIWWSFNSSTYQIGLTIFQMIFVFISIYFIVCVVIQYRKVTHGKVVTKYQYPHLKPKQIIVYDNDDQEDHMTTGYQAYTGPGHTNYEAGGPKQFPSEPYGVIRKEQKVPLVETNPLIEAVQTKPTSLETQPGTEPTTKPQEPLIKEIQTQTELEFSLPPNLIDHRNCDHKCEGEKKEEKKEVDKDKQSEARRKRHQFHSTGDLTSATRRTTKSHRNEEEKGGRKGVDKGGDDDKRSQRSSKASKSHRHRSHSDDDLLAAAGKSEISRHRHDRSKKLDDKSVVVPKSSAVANLPPPPSYQDAFSIPQNIVIPAAQFQGSEPRRFQINSEVIITYDGKKPQQKPTSKGVLV